MKKLVKCLCVTLVWLTAMPISLCFIALSFVGVIISWIGARICDLSHSGDWRLMKAVRAAFRTINEALS